MGEQQIKTGRNKITKGRKQMKAGQQKIECGRQGMEGRHGQVVTKKLMSAAKQHITNGKNQIEVGQKNESEGQQLVKAGQKNVDTGKSQMKSGQQAVANRDKPMNAKIYQEPNNKHNKQPLSKNARRKVRKAIEAINQDAMTKQAKLDAIIGWATRQQRVIEARRQSQITNLPNPFATLAK